MANASQPKRRIEFLDFIRGIAAFSVAVGHSLEKFFPAAKEFLLTRFSLGAFGVITFFILSGFVIPFTIEKYQNLRFFWTNRFFRLYPLYWIILLVSTAVALSPLHPSVGEYEMKLPVSLAANVTMLQYFIKQPHALDLFWTLGFELAFYGLMSILFLLKWNRASANVFFVGIMAIAAMGIAGALVKGYCAFPYRVFWMTCFLFGTATYRFWSGEMAKRTYLILGLSFALVVSIAAFINFFHFPMEVAKEDGLNTFATLASWIAAFGFFLLVTFGPKFRIPNVLLWLGRISYSVYIVHGLLLILPALENPYVNLLLMVGGTLLLSHFTYAYIEAPFQEVGKRMISRLKDRDTNRNAEA